MRETAESTPRDDAIRLLARREYARGELRERLAAKGHAAEDVEACLLELEEQGLQSDARFAESFLRSRVARGQGPIKLRAELGRRGIDDDIARQAFAELASEVDWFELAAEVLARRFTGPGETPRERARRERFLAGRGFDFEQLRHALTHAWDDI
ncbi:regulatory protein RecX [Halomonas elongata]|uniref:Regulatory protein RecX n=1 Tax=Halomonas elongata (strain ATCC 33173 / DSM 2581 / NBRC 15536 / NCIMB 2198 / 1H9) TaxID=768066 RepID=E1V8H2_HALED|nr:regulatory protein RecX [Halomonas elongata]WBF17371.1 recombination regulator RecX [Halomonas elongata]WPU46208.1 regulatory protein RecX [Halomonas elongata DSM 2581]CBV43628.1 RecX family transcription regulator RecX [Halomonas elongata DSM 2581]